MKKTILFNGLILIFGLLFFSFKTAPSIPPTNTIIDFDLEEFVPCANGGTGEVIVLSGQLHIITVSNINGNRVSGFSHFQPMGISGTGQTTGKSYHATGITQDHFSGNFDNGRFSYTFVNNYRLIGQGPGNNYVIHQTIHITINANGELTVEAENTSVTCK